MMMKQKIILINGLTEIGLDGNKEIRTLFINLGKLR